MHPSSPTLNDIPRESPQVILVVVVVVVVVNFLKIHLFIFRESGREG